MLVNPLLSAAGRMVSSSWRGKHHMVRPGLCSAALVLLYPATVAFWRFRRSQRHEAIMAEVRHLEDDDDAKIEAARQVVDSNSTLEFPWMYRLSLEFALFKTYAIPSISQLLQKTRKFETACGKRYDDTDLLLSEMIQNPLDSERATAAVARLNYVHAQFQTITNEDMLYVLSTFVLEPTRWIDQFEWRSLTAAERHAEYIFRRALGRRMGIRNIPVSQDAFAAWSAEYEEKHMVYAESNAVIAQATMELFLSPAPRFLHPWIAHAGHCLMDTRLRRAMGYPDPRPWWQAVVRGVLALRAGLLRWWALPRPDFLSRRRTPLPTHVGTHPKNNTLVPRFHIFNRHYAHGYSIEDLGNAPAGKVFPYGTCPVYRGTG